MQREGRASNKPSSLSAAGEAAQTLRYLNQVRSADQLAAEVEFPGERDVGTTIAQSILARRAQLGGMFRSLDQVDEIAQIGPSRLAQIIATALKQRAAPAETIEVERTHFRSLLLQNPNYFGSLEASPFKPVKVIQYNTTYEELVCVGLNPPFDRLETIVQIKRPTGYGGDICSTGSLEYVRFYVDLNDDGVLHDVGRASVRVYDIPGDKPLCYALALDFTAIRNLCVTENLVRVRAVLSWDVDPPPNTPGFIPPWGNVLNVEVQIQPRAFIDWGDLFKDLVDLEVKIPDPIGPIISVLDQGTKLPVALPQPLSLAQKKALYARSDVPLHRFAFPEVQQLLSATASGHAFFSSGSETSLMQLGLELSEVGDLLGKLEVVTDGDTSFEELRCIGLRPDTDLLEGVLTVKKSSGYSGGLCGNGSTEYLAFWIDAADGAGFTYLGTATVQVHDLQTIPADGLRYAVFLKADLAKYLVPCEIGPRVIRLRTILSWETAPPPGNPNYVPTWGNREECLIQLRPGELTGHIPLIETVGDMGVDDIDQTTGLATGAGVYASLTANQSPFGAIVTITGRIGDPPDSFGGGATPFKYKIEVSPVGVDDWHPLTNPITVKKSEFINGFPQMCGFFEFVCDVNLMAVDDGDGLGDGWYEYIEDIKGPHTRNLLVDTLAFWHTSAAMEGMWKIRITAKDPATSTVFPGLQEVVVRIDNTAPTAPPPAPPDPSAAIKLAITSATFLGEAIPAVDCGQFPVGTILTGTYEVHDPGTTSTDQHFGSLSLGVIPVGPAHGAVVVPGSRAFPVVPTTGEAGTWTLNTGDMAEPNPPTTPMQACGYVIRLSASDRTIVNSGYVGLSATADVGFCLVEAPPA